MVAAYPSMGAGYPTTASLPSAQPIYSPQVTPAYSVPQTAPQTAPSVDGYLGSVSDESLKVLNHFGEEGPALLNRYSCVLEDAVMQQAQNIVAIKEEATEKFGEAKEVVNELRNRLAEAQTVIKAAAEDNAAYHLMLTDPQLLAEYTERFFSEEGPYPVETAEDRLRKEVEAATPEAAQAPAVQQQAPAPVATQGYARPQMEMQTPGPQAGAGDFWNQFSQLSDRNPQDAWKALSQASPQDFMSKTLISEE